MFVYVLDSVQLTGMHGLSYRVLRWRFRARAISMDKLWPLLKFVRTMSLIANSATVTNNNSFRLPSVKYLACPL